jgi:nicotinamide-nucleotide amidase
VAVAEILSIGTELLLGQIVDTNAQYLAEELAKLGINSYFRTTVGDNKDRIKEALRHAFGRANLIITTGGLGPTADDLTTESIGEFFNVPMIFDEAVYEHIKKLFDMMKFPMPESNRKQAVRPEGSNILPNPVGTAPGIVWQIEPDICKQAGLAEISEPRAILTFPGVPRELKAMWKETSVKFLAQTYSTGVFWSCDLRHYGIGESALAEKFAHLLAKSNPTVAPYAGNWECRLRVTARADSDEEAKLLAQPIIDEIRRESGSICYGMNDDTLESVVGDLLTREKKTLSVAESCTGGLVSERLTDRPGSSEYITLNLVTYSNQAKMKFLGVPESVLQDEGAVSSECAGAMAAGVRKLTGSDIGLSVTGIAGPGGGTEEKPVGLVFIGLASENGIQTKKLKIPSRFSRKDIRLRTANEALNMVRLHLLNNLQ